MKNASYLSGLVLMVLAASITFEAKGDLDPVLEGRGWDEIPFDDKATNLFTAPAVSSRPGEAIDVLSDASVSVAFLTVDISIEETPFLEWEWLTRNPDPDTDTTLKGGDDRTLAVYIAFPWQRNKASFGERLQRPLVEALKGRDTPGRILTYVWGGGAAVGEGFENPYTGKYGRMIIRKAPGTPLNTWHPEAVNVRQDFIDAFGFEPVDPLYIAVGSDSDDTGVMLRSSVRGLAFSASASANASTSTNTGDDAGN